MPFYHGTCTMGLVPRAAVLWAEFSTDFESGQGIHEFFSRECTQWMYSFHLMHSHLLGLDPLSPQMGYETGGVGFAASKFCPASGGRHCPPVLQLKHPQKKDKASLDPSQALKVFLANAASSMGEAIVGRKRWKEKFRRVGLLGAGSGQWGGGGGGGGGGAPAAQPPSRPAAQPPSHPATQPPSHLVT